VGAPGYGPAPPGGYGPAPPGGPMGPPSRQAMSAKIDPNQIPRPVVQQSQEVLVRGLCFCCCCSRAWHWCVCSVHERSTHDRQCCRRSRSCSGLVHQRKCWRHPNLMASAASNACSMPNLVTVDRLLFDACMDLDRCLKRGCQGQWGRPLITTRRAAPHDLLSGTEAVPVPGFCAAHSTWCQQQMSC